MWIRLKDYVALLLLKVVARCEFVVGEEHAVGRTPRCKWPPMHNEYKVFCSTV